MASEQDGTVRKKIEAAESEVSEAVEHLEERASEVACDIEERGERGAERLERRREKNAQHIAAVTGAAEPGGKIALPLKVFAILCILLGVAVVAVTTIFIVLAALYVANGGSLTSAAEMSTQAVVLLVVYGVMNAALSALFIVFSVRILRNKRRNAALLTNVMIAFAVLVAVLALMLDGMQGYGFIFSVLVLLFLVVMHSYLDPQLADERKLQRKLKDMEIRSDAEEGVLGRDKTGRGYIQLNFFNLFWIFLVACFLGWCFEMAVCPVLNGRIEDRTGMLWGPFSPIYGVGATLMTIALNRFYKKNPVIVFVVSAFIGAAFEFFVSYFFEFSFGIKAWDYSGEFMNLAGRTDLFHGICWGVLGLLFVRFLLPKLLSLINRIPWNWRYGVTVVVASFMIVNACMTMLSFDCWFQRSRGVAPDTPVAQFFAEHYDNDFMTKHFPTMTMDPSRATHD